MLGRMRMRNKELILESCTWIKEIRIAAQRHLLPAIKLSRASVVSLKFVEEQKQILRLTTPELKDVRGPVRSE